jgi:CRISPR-associated protein Csd1
MFKELVELGKDLEGSGKLQPVGFYSYREPIRWIVHLWPDRIYLEETELDRPRPSESRTSATRAYPLADEASYALGVTRGSKKEDRKAPEKHETFRALIRKLLVSPQVRDSALREAVNWFEEALDNGRIQADPRFPEILAKDWVSFVPEEGPLKGQHLFEHPEVKAFWVEELMERNAAGAEGKTPIGECAICGQSRSLVKKMPKVKLVGTAPLHSLNTDAFVSYLVGRESFKRAHLSMCFICSEIAARAFNYLSNSRRHRRDIITDPKRRDSPVNQIALFWLKGPWSPIQIGETVLDLDELLDALGSAVAEARPIEGEKAPPPDLSQLARLLELPWKPQEAGLGLGDYGFYLAVLSPNVGRIALREWIPISLDALKNHLANFLQATRIVSPWGDPPRPQSIATMLQACEIANPNFTRGLLRTAYLGYAPPPGLLEATVPRFRNPRVLQDPKASWQARALVSLMKMALFYRKEEMKTMEQLDQSRDNPAYLCGRLLAILEQAQLRAANFKIKETIVDRSYGAASTAPAVIFGGLIRLATVAHLPKVGKDLKERMEEVMERLQAAGGFPKTLTLAQQAEFALGFYHERAALRAGAGRKVESAEARPEGFSEGGIR